MVEQKEFIELAHSLNSGIGAERAAGVETCGCGANGGGCRASSALTAGAR